MDTVNIEISKDLIKPIIEQKIKSAMIEALGDSAVFMDKIIHAVLNEKVDDKGQKNQYSSYNNLTFVDWVMRDSIQKAVHLAVTEWVTENQALIKESLKSILEKKGARDAMAKAMVEGLVNATKNRWGISASFSFETPQGEAAKSTEIPF